MPKCERAPSCPSNPPIGGFYRRYASPVALSELYRGFNFNQDKATAVYIISLATLVQQGIFEDKQAT